MEYFLLKFLNLKYNAGTLVLKNPERTEEIEVPDTIEDEVQVGMVGKNGMKSRKLLNTNTGLRRS